MVRWLSNHARLMIVVDTHGKYLKEFSLPLMARVSGSGSTVRALTRPASWANAATVTIVSMSLAGRSLPCDCLPVTLRVGSNHAPAPAGAVLKAAKSGDVAVVQAALDAGGSMEETDEVLVDYLQCDSYDDSGRTTLDSFLLQVGRTLSCWASVRGDIEVLRTLHDGRRLPARSNHREECVD